MRYKKIIELKEKLLLCTKTTNIIRSIKTQEKTSYPKYSVLQL